MTSHREYKRGAIISKATLDALPRWYGPYRWKGKTRYRNYHRTLKNGKGLNLVDIMGEAAADAVLTISKMNWSTPFQDSLEEGNG